MWNRNFLLLWQGLFVSHVGTQLFNLALLYWVLETTGSATLMGLVLMAAALPGALIGPFAGTLADMLNRKTLIVAADLVRGVAGLALVWALFAASVETALVVLLASQVISGICGAIFNPSVNAAIPDLVPARELQRANSVLQGTNALTSTASYGAGGFLYALLGAPWLFLINAISFLASALSECFIVLEQRVSSSKVSVSAIRSRIMANTIDGLKHVWRNPGLRMLLAVLSAINFVIVPTGIALPILVRDFLHRGPEFLGVMGAFQAAGGLVGFIATGTITIPARYRTAVVGTGLLLAAATVVVLGFIRSPAAILMTVTAFGFLLPVINVNVISVLQGTTPSEIRGRVMGVMSTLALGLIPIAQGLSGLVIDLVDQQVPLIYKSVGLVFAVLVVGALAHREFRAFLGTDYASHRKHAS